jgi:hypothetical protein
MLIGRTERGKEEDVASWPTTRQAARILGNFCWALAYALATRGNGRRRIGLGGCLGLDHRGGRLDGRCLGRRLGSCLGLDQRGGWLDGRCLGRRLDSCLGLDHRGGRLDGRCLGCRLDSCLGLDHRGGWLDGRGWGRRPDSCLGLDHRGGRLDGRCLGRRLDSCLGLDHRGGRLDGRCLGRRLGKSGSLSRSLAMALGLLSTSFLALDGGPIALSGMPGPPVLRGFLTSWAAVTSLGPRRQEPAFTIFK